jgi:hypothetical protein
MRGKKCATPFGVREQRSRFYNSPVPTKSNLVALLPHTPNPAPEARQNLAFHPNRLPNHTSQPLQNQPLSNMLKTDTFQTTYKNLNLFIFNHFSKTGGSIQTITLQTRPVSKTTVTPMHTKTTPNHLLNDTSSFNRYFAPNVPTM